MIEHFGEIVDVDPQALSVGEIIHIHPGERVPIDAQVTEGESWHDTSALSGESVPRRVEVGSAIFGGSVNTQGLLTACVTKPFGESAVSRMLALVETARCTLPTASISSTLLQRMFIRKPPLIQNIQDNK